MGHPHHTESCPEFNVNLQIEATSYVALGWSLLPVIGKKPAYGTTWKDPPSWDKVKAVLAYPGTTGVAVILGEPSGNLTVRDFDEPGSYDQWRDANPDLAYRLPTSFTPGSQGYHVFARTEHTHRTKFLDDGEFRAKGSIVVLPPSKHPDGGVYRWIVEPFTDIPIVQATTLESRLSEDYERTHDSLNLSYSDQDTVYTYAGGNPYDLDQDAWYTYAGDSSETTPTPHMAYVDRDKQSLIDEAIACTIPAVIGSRNRKIFELARRLKSFLGNDIGVETLRCHVVQWHRRSLPTIKTKDFGETWNDFVHAWQEIRTPVGVGLARIKHAASLDKFSRQSGDPNGDRVARVFRAASRLHGGREFYMAYRTLAECVDLSPKAARYIALRLVGEGLVVITRKGLPGKFNGKGSGKATFWHWTGGT